MDHAIVASVKNTATVKNTFVLLALS